uniref:Uncharacterized protein n=1 Tax=Oryza meridionalis TaxID=40149 RepID=A0A0E0D1A3_9ORYZ
MKELREKECVHQLLNAKTERSCLISLVLHLLNCSWISEIDLFSMAGIVDEDIRISFDQ